jgi:hypothetical protein
MSNCDALISTEQGRKARKRLDGACERHRDLTWTLQKVFLAKVKDV